MRRARFAAVLFPLVTAAATAQDPTAALRVGTASAARGSVAYGALEIPAGPDAAASVAVAVVHGARPGPVVAFVAGSHGTEYASSVAMSRLIARLDPKAMKGSAIVVPMVNVASFEQMTPHLNPVDGKSLNRIYPGDPAGTQTARILAAMTREVVAQADVIVDLHGGDLDEDLRPYSYWFRVGNAARDSASKRMALAFGLDHIIVANVDTAATTGNGNLSAYALSQGKASFVAEAGRAGLVLDEDVNALITGSLNLLGHLGVLDRRVRPVAHPVWLGEDARVRGEQTMMFFPTVRRDTRVRKGQVVGHATDFLGRALPDITAPQDGLVTFIRPVPSVTKGASLVTVTKILTQPGPWERPH